MKRIRDDAVRSPRGDGQSRVRGGEEDDRGGRVSIDEDELLKLLSEDVSPEASAPLVQSESSGSLPAGDTLDMSGFSGDFEREAAVILSKQPSADDAPRQICPVTPEDVRDISAAGRTNETVSSTKVGKESSADESSIEGEVQRGPNGKRKAETGMKSLMKKTKYYETDKTVRKRGWAEEMLKNRPAVLIPQKTVVPFRSQPREAERPVKTGKTGRGEAMIVGNGYHHGMRRNVGQRRGMEENVVPPGWLDCPGLEGKWGFFLLSKIGLVIDLTNSSMYYEPYEFERHGVRHCKIRCRGHGATPSPESVNQFWWAVSCFERQRTGRFILVHCTHGFNRTGFMVAHFTMRWAERDTMNGIVREFAVRRPPGIYKDEYINELLDYYHEPRSPEVVTPSVPEWKGISEEEKEDYEPGNDPSSSMTLLPGPRRDGECVCAGMAITMTSKTRITSDDVVGERLPRPEESFLQSEILNLMLGPQRHFNRFPGAQPVSMDRSNLQLLSNKRYWVTYKADGTRYMLLLMKYGTYVVNRDFEFQRVEMRFPVAFTSDKATINPGIPHHMTLLDGEMVVDYDPDLGIYTRKYLVYDLVLYQGKSWMHLPWKQRFVQVCTLVEQRQYEISKIKERQFQFRYEYKQEPFDVEAKMFRCLGQVDEILEAIPKFKHECDGFIFQAYLDHYKVGTHEELLKWKYAHMNSVDFRYRHQPNSKKGGQVFLLQRTEILCENVEVEFQNEEDKRKYDGRIIECGFNQETKRWTFLRERVDKKLPNALSVYEKVVRSIQDNITQQELVDRLLELFKNSETYAQDRQKLAAYRSCKE